MDVKATSDSFAKDQLKHTPCILLEEGRRLVRVEQVVIDLNKEREIHPFLYALPPVLFLYKGLFTDVQLGEAALLLIHCLLNRWAK